MRRIWQIVSIAVGLLLASLYVSWWRATAKEALDVIGMLAHTALFRWRELYGWRHWYALGGAITYLLVLLRFAPAALRWLLAEARPSLITITVGILVFFGVPVLGTVFVVVAWPLVLYWLAKDACQWAMSRRRPRTELTAPTG